MAHLHHRHAAAVPVEHLVGGLRAAPASGSTAGPALKLKTRVMRAVSEGSRKVANGRWQAVAEAVRLLDYPHGRPQLLLARLRNLRRVPRRDRPAQFAGVRTDAELNEIGEPLMLYCQPAPDYLPDPEACLITGITPQHCLEQGVPEHAFADAIEQRAGAAGHDRRRLQHDPLRRRGHALPVLAQPDRPVCARMAERVRPLGPARRGALHLRAAPRGHRVADARRRPPELQARAPDRAPTACCTRRRTMRCRTCARRSRWRA